MAWSGCLPCRSGNRPSRCAALVSLAEARELALANRKLARSGGDPLVDKRRVQSAPTFADAAQRVLEQKQGGWRGRWHSQNWWRSLERYAFPRIGRRPVSEVNTADVLEILTPISHVKAETARAVRQRIRAVLEWAIAMELRADNPCVLGGIHVSHSYLYIYICLSDHDSLVVPLFLNGNLRDPGSR